MLSIGEFSKICKVSTKTLRYYDEIGLINPSKINQENGYRYYSIEQLETMLFVNRLKQYNFSLEEIRAIITSEEIPNEKLSIELYKKKVELEKQIQIYSQITERLNEDIAALKQGKSIMSYLNKIDVQLVELPVMYLVSIRKMVYKFEMEEQYAYCFNSILRKIQYDKLTDVIPLSHRRSFPDRSMERFCDLCPYLDLLIVCQQNTEGVPIRMFSPNLHLNPGLHAIFHQNCRFLPESCFLYLLILT